MMLYLSGEEKNMSLIEFIRLENHMSELLGQKVNLILKDSLKPLIKDSVLKQAQEI